MYLLDTDVISRTSPLSSGQAGLAAWLTVNGDRSFISVISLSEMQYGVTRLLERGAHRRATALRAWMNETLALFADRVLPLDRAAAHRTGEILAQSEARGHSPGFEDACLAATADHHGMTVVTYNVRHFRTLGVPFLSPGRGEEDAP